MNLKKRLILSNILTVAIPLILTIAAAFIFGLLSVKVLHADLGYESFKRLIMLRVELMDIAKSLEQKIDEIEKPEFRDASLTKLKSIGGELLIIKKDAVYFSSKEFNKIDIMKMSDLSKQNLHISTIEIESVFYYSQTISFRFKDSQSGKIILIAPIEKESNNFRNFLVLIAVVFILTFIITNIVLSYIFSQKILKPVTNLKLAAAEISGGNLNKSIIEEGDDELRELCRDLEIMRLRLKEYVHSKMKYDDDRKMLISSISHDLKTPMTAIKGYVEGILDGVANTPEKTNNYLRTIYSKSIQVDAMIEDLLLYSKLDLNQLPFNFSKVAIEEYFRDCINEWRQDAINHNIELYLTVELTRAQQVMIDKEKMKRVVINVFENSRKYMKKEMGEINIILRETGPSIIVEIRDNGPGIPKEELSKIFERFYRIDAARSEIKGSGLGLAIAKGIVEGHKGKIWAISNRNEGLSILISLSKY